MTTLDLRLLLVTDTALCGDRGVADTVREAVAGGVTTVQVRAKTETAADALELVTLVATSTPGTTVLVNDRVDVYLAARAAEVPVDGVHVGQTDLPVHQVRDLVGPDAVVGLTANRAAHLDTVAALPPGTVDYLGVGVLRDTDTKPDHPPVLGISGFAEVCRATDLPCVAIGGIRADDVAEVRRAGGAGVAVVSAICGVPDPGAAARRLREEWDR